MNKCTLGLCLSLPMEPNQLSWVPGGCYRAGGEAGAVNPPSLSLSEELGTVCRMPSLFKYKALN